MMAPSEVHAVVVEMQLADYNREGQTFFDLRVKRLEAAGWKLGLQAYSAKVLRARRGLRLTLKHPRNQWYVAAHWYHEPTRIRVHYYNAECHSKQEAEQFAKDTPAPDNGFRYVTYSHPGQAIP